MTRRRRGVQSSLALAALLALCAVALPGRVHADGFDHRHGDWDALLQRHVYWIDGGVASQVDYAGFRRDRQRLGAYLARLSSVDAAVFRRWPADARLAFLINAYNAFTIELILTEYPDVESIKDLGSLFVSPWKREFFTLLGERRHLDDIEHDMIRARFDEPLIHVAVVCASVGCPALRDRAFTADNLEFSLTDSMRRFLADDSRNRYDTARGVLQVSKIFDWYREDFESGARGYRGLEDLLAGYAAHLSDEPAGRQIIRRRGAPIEFLDYDWRLNDRR